MSLNRAATRAAALSIQQALRGSRTRLPSTIPAIALLIPRHHLSTDTRGTSGSSGGPPPGFDLEKAKRPLPQESQSKQSTSSKSESAEDVVVARQGATAVPKTDSVQSQSLTELASEKAAAQADEKAVAKKGEKKLTIWQKVKHEAAHYWDGTKLLATEVRISSKLALKMAAGYELTRRENRQVRWTTLTVAK